jgi:hypothetical protein
MRARDDKLGIMRSVRVTKRPLVVGKSWSSRKSETDIADPDGRDVMEEVTRRSSGVTEAVRL